MYRRVISWDKYSFLVSWKSLTRARGLIFVGRVISTLSSFSVREMSCCVPGADPFGGLVQCCGASCVVSSGSLCSSDGSLWLIVNCLLWSVQKVTARLCLGKCHAKRWLNSVQLPSFVVRECFYLFFFFSVGTLKEKRVVLSCFSRVQCVPLLQGVKLSRTCVCEQLARFSFSGAPKVYLLPRALQSNSVLVTYSAGAMLVTL